MLHPVKRHLKYSPSNSRGVERQRSTEILSTSTVKRLLVEQGRFLKRE